MSACHHPDVNAAAAVGAASAGQAPKYERADGAARIDFRLGPQGRTALADLYQRAPCRVLFPDTEVGEPPQAVLLTTSGGLTGGDRTHVEVCVREGARATLTTQAAEKLYRARLGDEDTRIHVDMRVGPNAWAEWLAQETILFDGARMRRSFHADVDPSGRLLAVETAVFGRTAMGETFASGFMHDSWRVRRGTRLVWADAQRLEDDITMARGRPFGFGTAVACSTLVYVGVDAARLLETTRDQLRQSDLSAAATSFDGLLLVRVLSEDAVKARSVVMNLIAHLRSSAAGLPASVPRVWHC